MSALRIFARSWRCAAAAPVLLLASSAAAQGGAFANNDPTVAAAVTDEVIDITSRFTGASIDVFGVVDGLGESDDVVVTVRGPTQNLRLMKKRRVLGIWVNRLAGSVDAAPAYYAVAATRPLSQVAPAAELRRLGIGVEYAPPAIALEGRSAPSEGAAEPEAADAETADLRAAIIRIKAADGLYRDDSEGVDIFDAGLFHAQIQLPPGSPTGDYHAQVIVFRNGVAAARRTADLQVMKVGLERYIYDAAHDQPLLYGLSSVAFACFAGWAAATVYRRR